MPSLAQVATIAVASHCMTKHRYPIRRSTSLNQRKHTLDYGWSKAVFGLILVIHTFGATITFIRFMSLDDFFRFSPIEQFVLYTYVILNILYVAASWSAVDRNSIALLILSLSIAFINIVFCGITNNCLEIHVIRKHFYPSIWLSIIDWSGLLIITISCLSTGWFIHKIRTITREQIEKRETTFIQC